MTNDQIWIGFKNAMIYSVLFTIISVAVTLLAAYPMSRPDFKGKGLLNTLFVITMFFGGGLIPTYLLISNLGMLDTMWAVLIPGAFSVWNMIIARTYYMGIPGDMQEAAEIDGASEMVYFFKILLPLCAPIIATIAMWQFVGMWNSYFDAMIYLNDAAKQPLQLVLRAILIQSQPEPGMVSDMQSTAARAQLAELLKYKGIMLLCMFDRRRSANIMKRRIHHMKKLTKMLSLSLTLAMLIGLLAGCGGTGGPAGNSAGLEVDPATLAFPLAETATITGLTNFPAGTESEPNNRTIFKRLEEQTNVHVEWKTIQSDQWGEKIVLEMSNINTLPDFVFNAGFGDTDLLKYAKQGVIINLEEYIDKYMPNLSKVFEQAPEYRTMCTDEDGHIWALPWIEQLGYEKTAIQTVGNMSFINTAWLDYLGLEMPTTVDEFEDVLIAFRDNAADLKAEFNIEGDIIPMSCIMNDGDQDPCILINGFGEGYGDPDRGRHIAVTNDKEVICVANTEGFKRMVYLCCQG